MSKKIILDTDLDTDCDDVGALVLLHALADAGECELVGMVCSVPLSESAGAARAVNAACGRPGVPVGLVRVADYGTAPRWRAYREHRARLAEGAVAGFRPYTHALAATRPADEPPPEQAVSLYRRLLAAAEDRSITICAIGTLTALAALLASDPDEHSPLNGRELVAAKVVELVSMAEAVPPSGVEAFNWRMDPASAAQVLRDWPTPLTVSSSGARILTGARTCRSAPQGHPLRVAYETFLGPDRDRPSWDQTAVLYAVRGATRAPFRVGEAMGLTLDPDSAGYRWTAAGSHARRYAMPTQSDGEMAHLIEELMIVGVESLQRGQRPDANS